MFIEFLNKDEQEVFFSLALDLANVDGVYSDEERNRINTLSKSILGEQGYNAENLNKDLSTLENLAKKKVVLMELVGIAYIDGDYSDSEKIFIQNLAEKLGVEKSILTEVEDWALGLVNHITKGIELINK